MTEEQNSQEHESVKVQEQEDKKEETQPEPKPEEKKDEQLKKENKKELKDFSFLKPGITVKVHQKIQEAGKKKGEVKERVQAFEGIIIAIRGAGISKTITVRKVSEGIGVEKIFPLHLPTITKIELIKQAKVKRAKLYYLRNYKKRLKERKIKK